ncbi:hypothetical protein PM3016_762 [Paenibacillus mucilaginosus 3016]|uniref:Uncharacterized protein n=1 Tax=Paenibacillus mucilaginosus 3016 TaxID=1116391 RepID=H6N8X0_9BACL|nr:hypothetical protein PM3016_762 [Paenibacillus mucilaginosus 3016]
MVPSLGIAGEELERNGWRGKRQNNGTTMRYELL